MLADEIKYSPFDVWPKRLDCIKGERKTASIVGVQISNCRMRAARGERHGEAACCDAKTGGQKGVQGMRGVTLRAGLADRARSSWRRLFPLRRNAWRSDAPTKVWDVRPRYASGLRFNDHSVLHVARMGCCFNEPGGDARRKRPGLCAAGDLRLNDADCNRKRVGRRLRAQHRGALARACGQDGHKLAHPIENDNLDPMRSAEAHSLDRNDAAPTRHNDRGRHARTRIVSKPPNTIADKERAAPDGKVRVVGLRGYDARLDREPSLPKGVAFRVGPRVGYGRRSIARIWALGAFIVSGKRWGSRSQQSLPRRPGIRPRGYFGVGAIDSRAGRARIEPRQRRHNIDRIATRPPHADNATIADAARHLGVVDKPPRPSDCAATAASRQFLAFPQETRYCHKIQKPRPRTHLPFRSPQSRASRA